MSPTPEQCAQVLYLHQVEGVSVAIIAVMTGLSRSAVVRVLHQARRLDGPTVPRPSPMHPASKGRVERQIQYVQAQLLRKGTS